METDASLVAIEIPDVMRDDGIAADAMETVVVTEIDSETVGTVSTGGMTDVETNTAVLMENSMLTKGVNLTAEAAATATTDDIPAGTHATVETAPAIAETNTEGDNQALNAGAAPILGINGPAANAGTAGNVNQVANAGTAGNGNQVATAGTTEAAETAVTAATDVTVVVKMTVTTGHPATKMTRGTLGRVKGRVKSASAMVRRK